MIAALDAFRQAQFSITGIVRRGKSLTGHACDQPSIRRLGDCMAGCRLMAILSSSPYGFGETRVARLALLTFTALSVSNSGGVVITRFSGHAATFRSSPTVFAETSMPDSTSSRTLSGMPPRAMWRAPMFFGLYRMRAFSLSVAPASFSST